MDALKFRYVNWRGDDHEYVIVPDARPGMNLTFGRPDPHWYLNGEVITRDGDPREDMGQSRRRSFVLANVRDVGHVEVPDR